MNDVDVYTVKEVAARLKLSEDSIRLRVKRNEIPHIRLGGAIRFPITVFEDWLTTEARKTQAPEPISLLERRRIISPRH